MVNISQENQIMTIELIAPPDESDFSDFMQALNHLLTNDQFLCLMLSDGSSKFSPEDKKELGLWFKQHKTLLKDKCKGFCRVVSSQTLSQRLSSKAMALAMPFPYSVTTDLNEALVWLDQYK